MPLPKVKNDPVDILSAWTAIEVLSPQTFDKPEKLADEDKSKISYTSNGRWRWELDEESNPPKKRLFYQIVLGSIKMEPAMQDLLRIFPDSRPEPPNTKGEAVIAAITVDKSGNLVEKDPIVISSFAWGLGVALKGNLSALDQWPKVEKELMDALLDVLKRRNAPEEDYAAPCLTAEAINAGFDWLVKRLELNNAVIKTPVFAVKVYQSLKNQDPPNSLLLNSFFLTDLSKAIQLFKANNATANLRSYLGKDKPKTRHNLFPSPKLINERITADILQPKNYPLAAWPAKGRFPLVLLQQFAVNLAMGIKNKGILGVNGPPGTGKTTLLRDVVAGILTDRADIMSAYADPETAFVKVGQLKRNQSFINLYKVDEKLRGHEIVVASSNNKAVENVTQELPGLEAISDDAAGLRYFKTASDNLLERETWGIIAGVLGNSANRYQFQQKFWWDNEFGLQKYLQHASGNQQLIQDSDNPQINRPPVIVDRENPPNGREDALSRWQFERDNYKSVKAAIQKEMEDLQTFYEMQSEIAVDIEMRDESISKLAVNKEGQDVIIKNLVEAEQVEVEKRRVLDGQKGRHKIALTERPNFINRVFKTAQYKNWVNRHHVVIESFQVAENEWKTAQVDLLLIKRDLEKANQVISSLQDDVIELTQKIEIFKEETSELATKLSGTQLDKDFFNLSHKETQKATPWLSVPIIKLRHDLFEASIALHKAFIDAAAKPIRHNLNAFMDSFGMSSLGDTEKDEAIPHLWSTLFLVVPVISTTFASVERMFRKIEPENLGWLLIDEAGQAAPQQAIGALLRTRKALIVGDPLQVEPVVALPEKLTGEICRQFYVDPDYYNAPQASAQTLADAASAYFAVFETDLGTREVGVPLLVHRRCSSPMFDISNKVAYEDMMVPAKSPRDSNIKKILGEPRWINVQGFSNDKWCEEEGRCVVNLLEQLKINRCEPDLYIVTPFRLVQDKLRSLIRANKLLHGWVKEPDEWLKERVGTIHTVQGREAEAVIFVLGAPNTEQHGARGWAGKSPNLLNVAVTRAKESVYVVGNKGLWQTAGYFQNLTNKLPD